MQVSHFFISFLCPLRKRIGYLPDEEVHEIIEKICLENKISQSKVTGILVEEALRSRGVLKKTIKQISLMENLIIDEFKKNNEYKSNVESNDNVYFSHFSKKNLKEELQMINEFIEFKLFKSVINTNNNKNNY